MDHMFSYPHFPTFNEKLVGVVRVPRLLVSEPEIKRVQGQSAVMIREQLLLKARQSSVSPSPGMLLLDDGTSGAENGLSETKDCDDTEQELDAIFEAARRRFALVVHAVLVTQSRFRMWPKRRWYLRVRRAMMCMRRFVRITSLRRAVTRRIAIKSVVVIQKYLRRALARMRFKKYMHMVLFLQSSHRSRKLRRRYIRVRKLLLRLQGFFRGRTARKSQVRQLTAQIAAYRSQALCLWELENTSMSQRSSVWLTLTQSSYLHLAVLRDELLRLYDSLGVYTTDCPFFAVKARNARFSEKFDLVDKSVVVAKLRLLSSSGTPLGLLRKELELSLSQCSSTPSKAVCNRLTAFKTQLQRERLQLYTVLKTRETSTEGSKLKNDVFGLFSLTDPKKRKQHLVDNLWTSCSEAHAVVSMQVVHRIQQSPTAIDIRGGEMVVDYAQDRLKMKMAVAGTQTVRASLIAIQRSKRPKIIAI
jgi:hypothetical protein